MICISCGEEYAAAHYDQCPICGVSSEESARALDKERAQITADESGGVMDRLRSFLGQGMSFITEAPNPEIAAWQFSFALGTDNCVGHTMTSKARELNVTTACISKGATRVCRMLDIPPSPYMLPAKAQESYRQLRREQEQQREAAQKPKS